MSKRKRVEREAEDVKRLAESIIDDRQLAFPVFAPHKWISISGEGRRLVADRDPGEGGSRRYLAEEAPGVLLEFTRLVPSEGEFLRFADQYGFLRHSRPWRVSESWGDWWDAHTRLSAMVKLLERVRSGADCGCLQSTPVDGGRTIWTLHRTGRPDSPLDESLLPDSDAEHAAHRVLIDITSRYLTHAVGVHVLWHGERKSAVLKILPNSLLGLMWWQLARAVVGEVNFRPCKVCGRLIEIGSGAFTKARELCSPACKQQDHRNKVKRAKELKGEGKSVKQIAKELDTEPEVVTNWLTKKK